MSKRGKVKGPPFIQLFRWVTSCAAWKALTPAERVLYLELRSRYNGHNNGSIGLGCREAADAMNVGRDTANRAFGRLADLGFIEPTTLGQFRTNGRRATEWLLTELPDDRTGHKPIKTFMSWRAEAAVTRKKASPISRHVSPISRTQTVDRIDKMTLRPTARTQASHITQFASDPKDTSRSTITTAPQTAAKGVAEEAPVHTGRAHRSDELAVGLIQEVPNRSPGPIHVSDALRQSLAAINGKEAAHG